MNDRTFLLWGYHRGRADEMGDLLERALRKFGSAGTLVSEVERPYVAPLTARKRAAIERLILDGVGTGKIARRMKVSETTVRKIKARIRK